MKPNNAKEEGERLTKTKQKKGRNIGAGKENNRSEREEKEQE